jgi:hypothetical protein
VITYWDGKSMPVTIQAGDVLCIAGRASVPPDEKLEFEHVALAVETCLVLKPEDLLAVKLMGLPESFPESLQEEKNIPPQALSIATGHAYLGDVTSETSKIGSAVSVWNLAARHDQVDGPRAKYFELLLANDAGNENNLRIGFQRKFVIDRTLKAGVETNCMGFVCSFFEKQGLTVLKSKFPEYTNPYNYRKPTRDFPSPGHLMHALRLSATAHPYCPPNKFEAEKYSTAGSVLREVVVRPSTEN